MIAAIALTTIELGTEPSAADGGYGVFLVDSKVRAVQGTLLLVGSGVLAESLTKALGAHGTDVECTPEDRAAATADALLPDLIVLAGDAAQDRGAAVLAQLSDVSSDAPAPVLVICAPELDGPSLQPSPKHVGFLAPEGGVSECARRVQALLDLVVDQNLEVCTLQQLADTVSSRAKPAPAKPGDVNAPQPTAAKATAVGAAQRAPAKSADSGAQQPTAAKQAAAKSADAGAALPAVKRPADAGAPQPMAAKRATPSRGEAIVAQPEAAKLSAAQQALAKSAEATAAPRDAAKPAQVSAAQPARSAEAAAKPAQLSAAQPARSAETAAARPDAAKPALLGAAQPAKSAEEAAKHAQLSTAQPAKSPEAAVVAKPAPSNPRARTAQYGTTTKGVAPIANGAIASGGNLQPTAAVAKADPAAAEQSLSTTDKSQAAVDKPQSTADKSQPRSTADKPQTAANTAGAAPTPSPAAVGGARTTAALPASARKGTAQFPAMQPSPTNVEPTRPGLAPQAAAQPRKATQPMAAMTSAASPRPTEARADAGGAMIATTPKGPPLARPAARSSVPSDADPTPKANVKTSELGAATTNAAERSLGPSAAKSAFARTLLNAPAPQAAKADANPPTTSPRLGIIAKPRVAPKAVFSPAVATTSTDNSPTMPNPIISDELPPTPDTLSSAPTAPNPVIGEVEARPDSASNAFQSAVSAQAQSLNGPPPLPLRNAPLAAVSANSTSMLPDSSAVNPALGQEDDALDDGPTLPPMAAPESDSMPPFSVSFSEPPPVNAAELEAVTVRPSGGEINITFSEPPASLAPPDARIEPAAQPINPFAAGTAAAQTPSADRPRAPTNALEPAIDAPTSVQDTRFEGARRRTGQFEASNAAQTSPVESARRLTNALEQPPLDASAERRRATVTALEQPAQNTAERGRRPTSPLEQPTQNAAAERGRRPTSPLEQPAQNAAADRGRRPTSPLEQPTQNTAERGRRPTSPLEPVMAASLASAAISGSAQQPRRPNDVLQSPAAWPDSSSAALHDLPVNTKPRASKWRALAIASGVAAIGCGALLLQLRASTGPDHLAGRAAADALHYAPAPTVEPVAAAPLTEVTPTAPRPSPVAPQAPQPSAAVEHSPSTARSSAPSASASRAEPGSPQQLVEDGRTFLRQGHLGLAEGMFLKALQASPDSPAAMAEIVRVHLARHDGAEAARWANRLVGLQPNQGVSQLLLGDAEALRGDSQAAQAAWTRAARAGNATARERLDQE